MAKEISGFVKLQVKGGQANPAPPIGPALGSKGVNIMEFCSFQQLYCSRRSLDDEIEGFVGVNGNQNGKRFAHLILGPGIELLTELHDIDTFRTQCRAHWWCGIRLAAFYLQLNEAGNFFCHVSIFLVIASHQFGATPKAIQ